MDNKEIAQRISEMIIKNYTGDDTFAVQLFVEKVCVPEEVQSYSQQELKEHILKYLNKGEI